MSKFSAGGSRTYLVDPALIVQREVYVCPLGSHDYPLGIPAPPTLGPPARLVDHEKRREWVKRIFPYIQRARLPTKHKGP